MPPRILVDAFCPHFLCGQQRKRCVVCVLFMFSLVFGKSALRPVRDDDDDEEEASHEDENEDENAG